MSPFKGHGMGAYLQLASAHVSVLNRKTHAVKAAMMNQKSWEKASSVVLNMEEPMSIPMPPMSLMSIPSMMKFDRDVILASKKGVKRSNPRALG
jgi:hypothetical protein